MRAACVGLLRQICSGVASAHRRRLVHRDLKPGNIFIAPATGTDEAVKILDFGIARALEAEEGQPRLTQKGLLLGTPGFLAPEQIQSLDADARSDIYALGALLYFMITSRPPFTGDSPHAVFAQQVRDAPTIDPDEFGDRLPVAEVVLRAMRIDPEERFQTAVELAEALESAAVAAGLIDEPSRPISTMQGTISPEASRDVRPNMESETDDSASANRPAVAMTRLLAREVPEARRRRGWLPIAAAVGFLLIVAAILLLAL